MLVTFLLQFMFACIGVQLFKVRSMIVVERMVMKIFAREHSIHAMINQC